MPTPPKERQSLEAELAELRDRIMVYRDELAGNPAPDETRRGFLEWQIRRAQNGVTLVLSWLAETIRACMFTFEDLVGLDNRGMQAVLKEVAREDLMLALKTASPAMRDKIFGNLSQRATEILKDDMGTMGPVKLKDVEKAQANIVAVARRLESEQKITIGGMGGDDVIA